MSLTTENIAQKLGLDEGSGVREILAEIDKRDLELACSKERLEILEKDLVDARTELASLAAERKERRLGDLREQTIKKGHPDKVERILATAEELGYVAAGRMIEVLDQRPIGQRLQSAGTDPTPVKDPGEVELTERQKLYAKQLGVSEADAAEMKKTKKLALVGGR